MNCFFYGLLLILLSAPAALAQRGYRIEMNTVGITFPGKPIDTTYLYPTNRVRIFQVKSNLGIYNLLITKALKTRPPRQGKMLSDYYDNLIAGSQKAGQRILVDKKDVNINGFPAKEYSLQQVIKGVASTSRNWVVVIENQTYTVKFIPLQGGLMAQGAGNTFFDSFVIKAKPVVVATAPMRQRSSPWGRILVALPVLMALIWWGVHRWSRSRNRKPETEESDA
ncbi:MAG: hypothetical protein LH606_19700 [Cytophagaceae bacterium]|nr:hypothetical protein [Cytophagaceae bacterium]